MEMREPLCLLSLRLEKLLQRHGVLDDQGQMGTPKAGEMPAVLQRRLSGLIENMAELRGLIDVGRDARHGKPLSLAVMHAAFIMMEEVCGTLERSEEKQ
jgi:hypothetical protein